MGLLPIPCAVYTFTTEEYGDLISQYDGSDTLYHQYDGLGSTDALLDEWETATDRYAHRAFGLEAARSGTTDNPFTYVGRQSYYKDPELEVYLLGARYYDPQPGRFLSHDPLRYQSDDINLYAYVHNNPVNATDPSGNWRILSGTRDLGGQLQCDNSAVRAGRAGPGKITAGDSTWLNSRRTRADAKKAKKHVDLCVVENLHRISRCSQQVPPGSKSSAMFKTPSDSLYAS